MKKIISLISISALIVLSSCEQNSNDRQEQANALFVEGAVKANSAMSEYEQRNVKQAIILLEEAIANCDKILLEYPETSIAVSLASDKDINLGKENYLSLGLKLSEMKGFAAYVEKYGILGEFLYGKDRDVIKSSFKSLYDYREAKYATNSNITPEQILYFAASDFKQYPILNKVKAPQQKQARQKQAVSMEDIVDISSEIKMNVDLIAYEREALEYIYKLSEGILDNPELMELLDSHSAKMKANVARITDLKSREDAFLLLSKIYANMDKSLAANVALSDIKTEELSTQALAYYADKLIEREKLQEAMSLLAFVKVQSVKDDIAIKVSGALLDIDAEAAIKVLASCANEEMRKDAFVEICAAKIEDFNVADISSFLNNNVKEFSDKHLYTFKNRLNLFDKEDMSGKSDSYVKLRILGELAVLFAPSQKDFAEGLVKSMLAEANNIEGNTKEKADALYYLFNTVLSASLDVEMNRFLASSLNNLGLEAYNELCLKFFVSNSLNGDLKNAQLYFDMLERSELSPETLIIAMIKANKTKEEILNVIKI